MTDQLTLQPTTTEAATAGKPGTHQADDWSRALTLQRRLRVLAKRDPHYAAILGGRPSIRLAFFVATGHVQELTDLGRRNFDQDLDLLARASKVEAGLDANQFMDRLTGRPDPRRVAAGDHPGGSAPPSTPMDRNAPVMSSLATSRR